MDSNYHCPDCGTQTVRVIEVIPNGPDENKEACVCEVCNLLFYIIRN